MTGRWKVGTDTCGARSKTKIKLGMADKESIFNAAGGATAYGINALDSVILNRRRCWIRSWSWRWRWWSNEKHQT
jgi:hypothetical protein